MRSNKITKTERQNEPPFSVVPHSPMTDGRGNEGEKNGVGEMKKIDGHYKKGEWGRSSSVTTAKAISTKNPTSAALS